MGRPESSAVAGSSSKLTDAREDLADRPERTLSAFESARRLFISLSQCPGPPPEWELVDWETSALADGPRSAERLDGLPHDDASGHVESLLRPGTHAALSGARSRRNPISRRCSLRKRAQSARRSSDTNSPGSSGSGDDGDAAAWLGAEFTPHLGVETVENRWLVEPHAHRLDWQAARPGDFTTRGPGVGSLKWGTFGEILGKSANFCSGSSTRRSFGHASERLRCLLSAVRGLGTTTDITGARQALRRRQGDWRAPREESLSIAHVHAVIGIDQTRTREGSDRPLGRASPARARGLAVEDRTASPTSVLTSTAPQQGR